MFGLADRSAPLVLQIDAYIKALLGSALEVGSCSIMDVVCKELREVRAC